MVTNRETTPFWRTDPDTQYKLLERKRFRLPEEKQYRIFRLSMPEVDTLQYKAFPLYWFENVECEDLSKFSCIQELIYYLPYVDIYNLSDTVFVRVVHSMDMLEAFMITDDFTVKWMGFADRWVIDQLQYHNHFKKANRLMLAGQLAEHFRISIKRRTYGDY